MDMTNAERENMLRVLQGRVTGESNVQLGNVPGREYRIVPRIGPGLIVGRVYLDAPNGRAYVLMVGGSDMRDTSPEINLFFGSFHIDGAR
jgi:hypothetical protein